MSRFVTSRAVWAVAMMIRGIAGINAAAVISAAVTSAAVTSAAVTSAAVTVAPVTDAPVTDVSAGERTFSGVSPWEPDRELAVREAELRAMEAVRAWLEKTLDTAPTDSQLVRWLACPDVVRRETVERRERAYGEMSRATVSFTIRSETWESWRSELAGTKADRQRWRVARVLSTLLIGVAAVIGARLWDNRTQGYDRWRIGLISLPLFAAVNAAIWMI